MLCCFHETTFESREFIETEIDSRQVRNVLESWCMNRKDEFRFYTTLTTPDIPGKSDTGSGERLALIPRRSIV